MAEIVGGVVDWAGEGGMSMPVSDEIMHKKATLARSALYIELKLAMET